jgi:hypothetical protein
VNVLVIPENFALDQYVLKPLVKAMMDAVGRPRAVVRVCQDPLLGSVDQALKWERVQEVLSRYRGMVDLFLLIVDRDGEPHRRGRIDAIESQAAEVLVASRRLLGENAWSEGGVLRAFREAPGGFRTALRRPGVAGEGRRVPI